MSSGDEQARHARALLAGTLHGVLSSHSHEHDGYPFGTLVPYVIGDDGLPLMLLSHLSQHTRNVDADPRSGLIVIERGEGDVQQLARLSAIGRLLPDPEPADAERYFRYFPQTRDYFEQLAFRFYRYHPLRFHWNAGFATARWFGSERIVLPNPLSSEDQARIVEHMNNDHEPALRGYLGGITTLQADLPVEMLGIDAEGIDLRHDGHIHRIPFDRAIETPGDARERLVAMAS